jgi:branched-chain amino acid transport system substrate-binding protein
VWGQESRRKLTLTNINSLSGPFARYGQELTRGVEIALDRINEKGLRIGDAVYAIEQKTYDDKTDAGTAAKLVERAITNDRSHMIIASLGSVIVKACIPVAQRLHFPMMTHWAHIDGVFAGQKGSPWLYCGMPPFSRFYTGISEMVAHLDNPKIRTAGMIAANDELGVYSANEYFPADTKKAGLEYLGAELFPPKSQEYAPALERLRSKTPDILVINCYTPDIIGIFKEMQSIGWFPPVVVVEAPTTLAESLGGAIDGAFVPSFWDPKVEKTRDAYIGNSGDFTKLYKAKYNAEPSDFVAACGANNVIIYAQVLAKAGKIDDAQAINNAFKALDGETFFSAFRFDEYGLNGKGAVYGGQFQNGRVAIVYPTDVRSAEPMHPFPLSRK